jgi:hypothetical protein
MRVGVLTFHWADNYGAVLQAHGLCQTLKSLGHVVRFIDYVLPTERLAWGRGWGLRSGRQLPVNVLRRFRYEKFRHDHLPLSRPCHTAEDLRAVSAEFDAVIVGSDQVWNGNILRFDDAPYFLDFVDKRCCRRISYAACFGERDQPRQTLEVAALLLPEFGSLSVRNEMSADLVSDLSGRAATVVLDPTLLHDFSDVFKPSPRKASYIAAYHVSKDAANVSLGQKIQRAARQHLQLPIVAIGPDAVSVHGDSAIVSAGPSEWLRLLHGASFICTDSYHGTLFATKYRKPFITWSGLRTARISSFLDTCGLRSRLIGSPESSVPKELLETPIDYDAVFERLVPRINASRTFLESALGS